VINDRVEADLGQRVAQLGRGAVERPGFSREIGPEIDNRDRVSIGHGFRLAPAGFEARIAPLSALSNRKSPAPESPTRRPSNHALSRKRRC
jgi:hypothetical protein